MARVDRADRPGSPTADLLRWLDAPVNGDPQLVVCSGEAGIGKIRLVSELAERAQARGLRTLWTRTLSLPDAPLLNSPAAHRNTVTSVLSWPSG